MKLVEHLPKADGPVIHDHLEVARYLAAGEVVVAGSFAAMDEIDPSRGAIGSACWQTDGNYVWPGELEYYVREYGLAPDEELLAHIRKVDYKCAALLPEQIKGAMQVFVRPGGPTADDSQQTNWGNEVHPFG